MPSNATLFLFQPVQVSAVGTSRPTPPQGALGHPSADSPALRNRHRRELVVSLLLALAFLGMLIFSGCSKGPERLPVFPVKGKVLHDGQPAAGAFLVFHPLNETGDNKYRPTAEVGPDGSYTLSTYDANDGAPAGKYAVTVIWRKLEDAGEPDDEKRLGPNLLPASYATPTSTSIKVDVAAGPNDLATFNLTGDAEQQVSQQQGIDWSESQ